MNLTPSELLRLLPSKERIVLRRRLLRGETLQQIGDAVGMTRQGAGRIQERGLRRLWAVMGDRDALLRYVAERVWGMASMRMLAQHHGADAFAAAMVDVLKGLSDDELREFAEVL